MGDKNMDKEHFIHLQRFERRIAYFRWFLIIVVWPIIYFLSDYQEHALFLQAICLLATLYNGIITYATFSKNLRFTTLLESTMYFDVLIINCVVASRGGLNSDVFFFYFIAITYHGAKLGVKGTIHTLIFSMVSYTIISVFFTADTFSLGRFLIRVITMPVMTVSIYEMNRQVMKSANREREALELACRDPLTCLPNRMLLKSQFEQMIAGYKLTQNHFAIILFDIDNFKKINDSRGHSFGDNVLKTLADVIQDHMTASDFACRFGGEEFLILLKDGDPESAYMTADRIRRDFASRGIGDLHASVSGGLHIYDGAYSIIDNINFADEAMYSAKAAGKNLISLSEQYLTRQQKQLL